MVKITIVGLLDSGADEIIPALQIEIAEHSQGVRIKTVRIDFAFDGMDITAAAYYKVYLPARFVAPIK